MKKLLYLLLFLSFGVSAQPAALYHSMLKTASTPPPSGFQTETVAYMKAVIDNGGTWDSTGYKAIDTLVRDLKGLTNPRYPTSNVLSKFSQILPFYGSIAATHKFNLLDTSTYQATFVGSPTHNSSGVSTNGSTSYINTNFSSSLLTYSNNITSIYYFVPITSTAYAYGVYDGGSGVIGYSIDASNVLFVMGLWKGFTTGGSGSILGNMVALDFSSTSRVDIYADGVSKFNATPASGSNVGDFWIGGMNNGGTLFTPKQLTAKFWGVGTSLTSSQHIDYSKAVTEFQNRLSRP